MFSSFDNHGTAALVLLAAPVAFAVFILFPVLTLAASAWILRILGKTIRTSR
jgi:small neutral amino acid transporter SnatA (MarC family)